MPFSGSLIVSDSRVSCLTPVHAHSPRAFLQGLSSPLRSRLPMTRWRGACEEAPLSTTLDRASHTRVQDGVSVLLGSRDCVGPIWMCCLHSVNQGKEAVCGPQVLICTVHGKICKRGQWVEISSHFYSTFKTKWAPPWKPKYLEWSGTFRKRCQG